MALPEMQVAEINGVKLEIRNRGAGEPVAFVHGGMGDECFAVLAEPTLTSQYRLIDYHRRGWGKSEHPGAVFSIALVILLWWSMSFLGDYLILRWPFLWPIHLYLQEDSLHSTEYILNRIFLSLAGLGMLAFAIRKLSDENWVLLGKAGGDNRN